MTKMLNLEQARKAILSGDAYILAGDEDLLRQLPSGNWIGGTTPYFMGAHGGTINKNDILFTQLPPESISFKIREYNTETLHQIPQDYYRNGFSLIVVPGLSDIHMNFAKHCFSYPGIFQTPLTGWITGVHLDSVGKKHPKVFNGQNGESYTTKALVMHVELPANMAAHLDIINIFSANDSSEVIEFFETSFEATSCLIDGNVMNLAEYLSAKHCDPRFPLIANYSGAKINVAFQKVDLARGTVSFYAPVFPGVKYRLTNPISNYEIEFSSRIKNRPQNPHFSCNCILNYIYADLQNKKIGTMAPITFGEIAYILLNQTLVGLYIKDIDNI